MRFWKGRNILFKTNIISRQQAKKDIGHDLKQMYVNVRMWFPSKRSIDKLCALYESIVFIYHIPVSRSQEMIDYILKKLKYISVIL